jgi:hypothetical protein
MISMILLSFQMIKVFIGAVNIYGNNIALTSSAIIIHWYQTSQPSGLALLMSFHGIYGVRRMRPISRTQTWVSHFHGKAFLFHQLGRNIFQLSSDQAATQLISPGLRASGFPVQHWFPFD